MGCLARVSEAAEGVLRATRAQRRALEIALSSNDPGDGWLTARRLAKLANLSRVTASRSLSQLEELGVIKKDPQFAGRSTRYSIVLEEAEAPSLIRHLKWE